MTLSFRCALLSLLVLFASGCDNVGRAFDRDNDPDEPDPDATESIVQVVPVGGFTKPGRPKVRTTNPEGPGWPAAVPVVVEFNESVNEASILPTSPTATDARVILRVKGSTTALPCQYDFLMAGRVLVLRPITALSVPPNATYEVVLLADSRDSDGVRFQVETGGTVLTEFQTNQDASFTDGRILALCPRDNATDHTREGDVLVVFDRPANAATVVAANCSVAPAGGSALAGTLDLPLSTVGVPDGRVVRFRPQATLLASTTYELTVDGDITFGQDGNLDFRGRTPFADFETVAPTVPTDVEMSNPTPGFPDQVNRGTVDNVVLRVTTPADTLAGDKVRVRIYGGDKTTNPVGDLGFVERIADVTANGAQTIDVSFAGALGTLGDPDFDDGELTFTAQMQRGAQYSTWVHQPSDSEPRFDITPPTLAVLGPPASADGMSLFVDQEDTLVYGRASEKLAAASFADGVNTRTMYACDDAGRFVLIPAPIGRLATPRAFTLTLTDLAGNLAAATVSGTLVQRGHVTGTLAGTLVVEAFDAATMLPVAGTTVLVDPGTPTVPATGQLVGTTDANGLVTFTGLVSPSHTVTLVRSGYHLITMYSTPAARVSMPLTSTTASAATATGKGTVAFTPGANVSAIVGNTAVVDRAILGIRTTNGAPNTIPDTAITPNRLQLVTGFAGTFEPTAAPEFTSHGALMMGPTLTVPTPPGAPATPGADSRLSLALAPATAQYTVFTNGYTQDLALATGLDTGTLVGGKPRIRVGMAAAGFANQGLLGLGFATNTMGSVWSVSTSHSSTIALGLAPFVQTVWSVLDAEDGAGRIMRTRQLLVTSLIFPGPGPLPLPEITPPGGPVTGSPAVSFVDGFDPAVAAGSLSSFEVTATDSAGRRWLVFAPDRDGAVGPDTVQFPDLTTAAVTGLALGAWSVRAEARLWFSTTGATIDDCVLAERGKQEVNYARSAAVTFTVQ